MPDEHSNFFDKKLKKFPYIQKYYNIHLSTFNKSHPLICHLMCNTDLLEFNLEKIDKMLRKLDNKLDFKSIIKESKNPEQFFASLSELKVAAKLIDNTVDLKKIPKEKQPTPDFEIRVDEITFTLEVKRIRDKLTQKPRTNQDYAEKIDDIKTMRSHLEKSFVIKKQFKKDIPHVIIFDCGFSTVDDIDFEDLLYCEPDKIFHQKEDSSEYIYSDLSGVIGIFDKNFTTRENGHINTTYLTWIFYKNPNAKKGLQISEKTLNRLEIKRFQEKK
jgi:hypothetical protein